MSIGFAKKVGMTRIFIDSKSVPVTVIEISPSYVLQTKTIEKDGYQAVQIGANKRKKRTKAAQGHINKYQNDIDSGLSSIAEFKDFELEADKLEFNIADFQESDTLNLTAVVKGRGFAGVVKRHGFRGQPASHGHDHKRAPGSIGSRWPQRVDKGKKMAGRMGGNTITLTQVKIVAKDADNNLLFVKGSIPGPNGGILKLRKVNK